MKAILTVGISGSGKTTWASEYCRANWAFNSNRDDIRFATVLGVLENDRDWSKYKFNKANEAFVTEVQHENWKACARNGADIVVSDTHLNPKTRSTVAGYLKSLGYEIEYKDFPITWEEACRRDSLRRNGVGKEVLYKQWKQWLEYSGRLQYKPQEILQKAVIFDIDGTMAHMNGRFPYEWEKIGTDTVDPHVRMIINAYVANGYAIIALSGRDGICYHDTCIWMETNKVKWTHLFMRLEGDQRKDSIIKEEIFWNCVAPYYNVEAVFDDRPQVVRMWNDIGIPKVFAIGDQREEF